MLVNAGWLPGMEPFDPYPYILLTMFVSMEGVLIATFVFERVADESGTSDTPIGVEIEIRGATNNLQDQVEEIAEMISSTTYRPAGQEEDALDRREAEPLHGVERGVVRLGVGELRLRVVVVDE